MNSTTASEEKRTTALVLFDIEIVIFFLNSGFDSDGRSLPEEVTHYNVFDAPSHRVVSSYLDLGNPHEEVPTQAM
jgi:hypothetical protein